MATCGESSRSFVASVLGTLHSGRGWRGRALSRILNHGVAPCPSPPFPLHKKKHTHTPTTPPSRPTSHTHSPPTTPPTPHAHQRRATTQKQHHRSDCTTDNILVNLPSFILPAPKQSHRSPGRNSNNEKLGLYSCWAPRYSVALCLATMAVQDRGRRNSKRTRNQRLVNCKLKAVYKQRTNRVPSNKKNFMNNSKRIPVQSEGAN